MLSIIRRIGLWSPEAPSIPGMQVLDWRIVELKTNKAVIALCHKDAALYVTLYEDKYPPDTRQLTESSSVADIEAELRLDAVDLTKVYPAYIGQSALYLQKDVTGRNDIDVKQVQILDLIAASGMSAVQTTHPSESLAHEASICERLGFRQHANIAEFLGAQVRDRLEFDFESRKIAVPLAYNSVVGLVFKKYDCTLHDMVVQRKKLNAKLCLQSVSAGIQYLHGIGLVHGDIRPHSVYVKRGSRDQFVIGDFGCVHSTGSVVTYKTGNPRWGRHRNIGIDTAQEEDDWSAFRMLIEWLVGKMGGKLEDYKNIRQTRQLG